MVGIEKHINNYLLKMGFVPNVKGYHLIREALKVLIVKNRICNLKSEVYPILSLKFSLSVECVEKDIANAIDKACLKCNPDVLYKEFVTIDESRGKPTVKEFLSHARNKIFFNYLAELDIVSDIIL